MERFVLLATRRSGTTLFSDVLNGHQRVHIIKRAFGMERRIKNPTSNRHSGRFFLYRTKSISRRVRFYLNRAALIAEFLHGDIFEPVEGKDVIGFRLTYGQLDQYPQILPWLQENQVKLIHLVRLNVLKTYVSELTAPLHRMHHPRKGAEVRTVTLKLNAGRIRGTLDRRVAIIERMRKNAASLPNLEVAYESFSAHRDGELAQILPFLGIEGGHVPETDLIKINPNKLSNIIENYGEVEAALRGSPHERFLD